MPHHLTPAHDSRLDVCVTEQLPGFSRATISKLISTGHVTVNDVVQTKAGHRVNTNDAIAVDVPDLEPQPIELPIIYEDDDVIVIDKPAGVLTHSKGAFNPEGTVATFIAGKIEPPLRASERGGIVHRLDRDTSGVIICAKTSAAADFLQKQFASRKAKKTYTAVAKGLIKDDVATLKWPIERNPKKPQTFRVGANGKPAETAFTVLQRNEAKNLTLVALYPYTGRTHQLRVHLLELGHPILGDRFYDQPAERLWLHAAALEIAIPNGGVKLFESPVPDGFKAIMGSD